jgi:DNA repair ATPase RecN
LQETPKLIEEIVELYYRAKLSKFTKMEGVLRKLDQLSITLGKFDYAEKEEIEKKPKFLNYSQAVKEFRSKVELMMHSPYGTSLPENTQKSIITFINYLNHPELYKMNRLFDEIYEKYEEVKASEFMKMQTFNDLLNKLEIKLGTLTQDMKKYKTIEEKIEELDNTKNKLSEEWNKLKVEHDRLNDYKGNLEKEWGKLKEEQNRLKFEQDTLKKEWEKLEIEQKKIRENQ